MKDVNFEEILDIFKAKNRHIRFTRSINMYWMYSGTYDCEILICSAYSAVAGFHTEFKGDAIMFGGMSCKNHDLGGSVFADKF